MKYFGVIILILLVVALVGCNVLDSKNSPFTIQFNSLNPDLTVTLNGSVVDQNGFTPRQGVNRVIVFRDNEPIWVGQWVSEKGTIEEFIQEISVDEMLRITSKGNRLIGVELVLEGPSTL